jgi:tetrahydromethanopterin S-methyltransferase subunit G
MAKKATEKPKKRTEGFGEFYAAKVLSQGRENLVRRELVGYSCFGELRMEQDLFGWKVHTKRRVFECDSELEARYLMIFLELGWREIYVPKDLEYFAEIMPRLDYLKARLDRVLTEGLKRVFGRKIRQEARTIFYRKVSAIPEDAPKFDDDKFADFDDEAEESEEDFEEELEEEYA